MSTNDITTNQQSISHTDVQTAARDLGVIAFGLLAIAALLVSMPATYDIMSRYHTHDEIGATQAVASLIVFELGAIISKLATLLFPWWKGRLTTLQIALLLFVAGANALATTAAAPTGETLQAIAFAGLLPFFQAVFLALCVARVKALQLARLEAQATREPTQAERLAAALAEQQEKAFRGLLDQVTSQMTIATIQPAQLPAPKTIGFAAASVPKLQAVTPQTDDQPAESATDEVATRNAPKTYTCKKCGQEGFTFQELGQHSRKCKH